jgi:hypothetical protein
MNNPGKQKKDGSEQGHDEKESRNQYYKTVLYLQVC